MIPEFSFYSDAPSPCSRVGFLMALREKALSCKTYGGIYLEDRKICNVNAPALTLLGYREVQDLKDEHFTKLFPEASFSSKTSAVTQVVLAKAQDGKTFEAQVISASFSWDNRHCTLLFVDKAERALFSLDHLIQQMLWQTQKLRAEEIIFDQRVSNSFIRADLSKFFPFFQKLMSGCVEAHSNRPQKDFESLQIVVHFSGEDQKKTDKSLTPLDFLAFQSYVKDIGGSFELDERSAFTLTIPQKKEEFPEDLLSSWPSLLEDIQFLFFSRKNKTKTI